MSEQKVPMIYSAICGVMEDVGAVGKNDVNKQQGFRYRGIDAVMNALNPAMIKHKIFCTPEVLEQSREERVTAKGSSLIYSVCRMRYKFFATDGSFVETVVVGEGMDSGDKATNKAMAVAFKYACFQTFCIPTENLIDDPDKDIPDGSMKKQVTETKTQNNNGDESKAQNKNSDPERDKILKELMAELSRSGYSGNSIFKTYKVDTIDSLTNLQIKDAIKRLKKCPDKVDA